MPVVRTFCTVIHMATVAILATVAMAPAAGNLTGVPQANPKIVGVSVPTVLSPELRQFIVAQGSIRLENGTPDFPLYGYNGDRPMVPAPGDVQAPGHNVEATKTEPDKNTYLILSGQHGPDPAYDYGTHYTPPPLRLIAQGRDDSATIDSALGSIAGNGFQNDGDNEITGIHISDGDPTVDGILGAKQPRPFRAGWRVFYTQQHGDNITYEIRSK
jgi:hypothetical protein